MKKIYLPKNYFEMEIRSQLSKIFLRNFHRSLKFEHHDLSQCSRNAVYFGYEFKSNQVSLFLKCNLTTIHHKCATKRHLLVLLSENSIFSYKCQAKKKYLKSIKNHILENDSRKNLKNHFGK